MDQEDHRSEAAAKSRRCASRALKRLRTVHERERRERRAREREQATRDPIQAIVLAMSRAATEVDRRRLAMRNDRRRRQFEHAEQALVGGSRALLIIGAPTSLAGINERLRLVELANDVDALVIYIDDDS